MTKPASPARRAFADESFSEATTAGFYVLAAAVFDPGVYEDAVATVKMLRGYRNIKKLHWSQMERRERLQAAEQVANLEGLHVVTVGTPVPPRKQERARALCLRRLVCELHSAGIDDLLMESRTPELDGRDVRTVIGARYLLHKGSVFRVDHKPGAEMPLFWAADIVAGAVRAARTGEDRYLEALSDCVYEVDVETGL